MLFAQPGRRSTSADAAALLLIAVITKAVEDSAPLAPGQRDRDRLLYIAHAQRGGRLALELGRDLVSAELALPLSRTMAAAAAVRWRSR